MSPVHSKKPMEWASVKKKGIVIEGFMTAKIKYADYQVVVAESEEEVQAIQLSRKGKEFGMKIDNDKRNVMLVGKERSYLNISVDAKH